jgi:hypothetical protein
MKTPSFRALLGGLTLRTASATACLGRFLDHVTEFELPADSDSELMMTAAAMARAEAGLHRNDLAFGTSWSVGAATWRERP